MLHQWIALPRSPSLPTLVHCHITCSFELSQFTWMGEYSIYSFYKTRNRWQYDGMKGNHMVVVMQYYSPTSCTYKVNGWVTFTRRGHCLQNGQTLHSEWVDRVWKVFTVYCVGLGNNNTIVDITCHMTFMCLSHDCHVFTFMWQSMSSVESLLLPWYSITSPYSRDYTKERKGDCLRDWYIVCSGFYTSISKL